MPARGPECCAQRPRAFKGVPGLAWPGRLESQCAVAGLPLSCVHSCLNWLLRVDCEAALWGRVGRLPAVEPDHSRAPQLQPQRCPFLRVLQTCSVSSLWWVVKVWGGAA